MTARAVVVHDAGQAPLLQAVKVDAPRAGEVSVRMAASGICGSDVHVLKGRSNVASFPMVLGHEGSGVVESVGPEVRGLQVGDHVVLALYGPCGECPQCQRGRFSLCQGAARLQAISGRMPDGTTRLHTLEGAPLHPMVGAGTLAEYAVLRAAQVVAIPKDIPLDLACLAGCGVTTGLGAVFNTAAVAPGDTVAVVGCGGVGLNVVQGCRIAGATQIVAIDTNPAKLEMAARLGATVTVATAAGSIAEAVNEVVDGGVDVAFEAVGAPTLVAQVFEATRAGGTCVMVGSPPAGTQIPLDSRSLFNERRLVGCVGGGNVPARDIPRIFDLYRLGLLHLDELVSTRHQLDDFAAALGETERGEVARSVVLAPS